MPADPAQPARGPADRGPAGREPADRTPVEPTSARLVPCALAAAAAVVGLEGLAAAGVAVANAVSIDWDRPGRGLTSAIFLLVYAAGLLVVARGLLKAASWSRGPAVFAQLIQLGVAWNFWGGTTTWVAVVLGAAALTVLGMIFRPGSTEALVRGSRFTP